MAEYVTQMIDNYRLIRLLGHGGFGEVHLAEHIYHKTLVALKALPPLDQDELPNFLNEARIIRLNHPNIIRMLDFGVDHDTPFLVMEYAPHGTLRQRHPRGTRLSLPTLITYVQQIAEALQYAHDERLIHRDVKPENMLVGAYNELLLSDFGAALVARSSFLKITQSVVGTATYMAPEQLEGKPCFASDQYALGIVVYEWLCGDTPFHGNGFQLYQCHSVTPPPSLRARVPTLSLFVEQAVMKALAKQPEQRFSSVREFANALEQAAQAVPQQLFLRPDMTLQTHSAYSQTEQIAIPRAFPATVMMPPIAPEPEKKGISRRAFLVGAVFMGAAVAGVGLYIERAVTKGSPATPAHKGPDEGTTLATYTQHNEVFSCAWSWDNKYIASAGGRVYSSSYNDTDIHVWDALTGKDIHTFSTGNGQIVRSVDWSPIDHRIASGGNDGTVRIWNLDTGNGNILYSENQISGDQSQIISVAWSPTGDRIAIGCKDGLALVVDVSTGTILAGFQHNKLVHSVSWSPDGKYIASASDDQTVQVWDSRTEKLKYTLTHFAPVGAAAWSPDGVYIASGEYNDTDRLQLWHAAAGQHFHTYPGGGDGHQIYSVAWSPNSKNIVSGGQDNLISIWKASAATKAAYVYHGHYDVIMAVRWSPSGQYIASCGYDKTVKVWIAPQDN